ncbi:Mycobacterium numidiamassiliense ORFan [Mycobacterium numidiamassiliense]|uniref:Mycobacterium numidiamassiliense ORFan n=1 Tax=Mycobacterium numidiamassiliense TaxID=1841861 RepID=A0A2U3PIK9_9MYCO|nr:hypothetical protein [Mycobacterium numidiamassiliense]SPM43593.1 Mycobacterium numidiamassiliense ORFan [Mycobacterium numidiamassiliense]
MANSPLLEPPHAAAIAVALREGIDTLRGAAALAAEHSTDEHVPIPVSPRQARALADAMEWAALHLVSQLPPEEER